MQPERTARKMCEWQEWWKMSKCFQRRNIVMDKMSVFFCYSHKDERLRKKLETHLAALQQEGLIIGWHSRNINAGTRWEREVDIHLNTAQIILLLISADFLASR